MAFKTSLLALAIACNSLWCIAQVFQGIVTDSETGNPLSNVEVKISEDNRTAYTNSSGQYSVTANSSSVKTLSFELNGYMFEEFLNLTPQSNFNVQLRAKKQSTASQRMQQYQQSGCYASVPSNPQWNVSFQQSNLSGDLAPNNYYTRRDPSAVIQVNGTYYVWYSYSLTNNSSKTAPWDYNDIYYATSTDGYNWNERGAAVVRGQYGSYDARSVFTTEIFVHNSTYYLVYQAAADYDGIYNRNSVGMAYASSPNGPWTKLTQPVLRPTYTDNPFFDNNASHDPCIISYNNKFYLYYKGECSGCYNPCGGKQVKWGVAIADSPTGPYQKSEYNPVTNTGHEVSVWNYNGGVAILQHKDGPEANTIQYAQDGVNFEIMGRISNFPEAPGLYRPNGATSSATEGVNWGLCHVLNWDYGTHGWMYLQRFDRVGSSSSSSGGSSSGGSSSGGSSSGGSSSGGSSSGAINLALNKTATQSSNYNGSFPAGLAVDGSTSNFSHTQSNANAWWQVDLGAVSNISSIEVYNRVSCCQNRLQNFYVFVSDVPFTSTNLNSTRYQTGVNEYYTSGQAGFPTDIDINRTGRYVRVQLSGTNFLHPAEVRVMGTMGSSSSGGSSSGGSSSGGSSSGGSSSGGSSSGGSSSGGSGSGGQTAYPNGTPHTIPGIIKSVEFDNGGEGIAYHDLTSGNSGSGSRQDTDVDTENRTADGNVGWISAGEWLEYTVDVASAGNYNIEVQVASAGNNGKFHIEFDGSDKTGVQSVSATGSWGSFVNNTITDVYLNSGQQTMRVYMDGSSFNMGTLNFTYSGSSSGGSSSGGSSSGGSSSGGSSSGGSSSGGSSSGGSSSGGSSSGGSSSGGSSSGGTITVEAEDFTDHGGTYNDGQVPVGVGINPGVGINWINNGDWVEYHVSIPQPGLYVLVYYIASPLSNRSVEFAVDGSVVNTTIVPNTGNWESYQPLTASNNIDLTTGNRVIRITPGGYDRWTWNLDKFTLQHIGDKEQSMVSIGSELSDIHIYPNPANDVINIMFQGEIKDNTQLMIYQSTGILVKTVFVDNSSLQLNTDHLSAGMYIVKVVNGSKVISKSFFKN